MSIRGRRASASSMRRAPLFLLRRLGHVDRGGAGCGGIALEVLPHLLERRLRVDVADDREDGVVRGVVGLEERGDVVDRRRAQVGHRADHRMLVGEVVVRQLVDRTRTSCRTAGCRRPRRRSSCTALRWLSRFACVMSSERMRSASRNNAEVELVRRQRSRSRASGPCWWCRSSTRRWRRPGAGARRRRRWRIP